MRTEDQIKRKLLELIQQRQSLNERQKEASDPSRFASELERLDDRILLLEWVLNAPSGTYHL